MIVGFYEYVTTHISPKSLCWLKLIKIKFAINTLRNYNPHQISYGISH
jgi:hypothetical protein